MIAISPDFAPRGHLVAFHDTAPVFEERNRTGKLDLHLHSISNTTRAAL